MGTFRLYSGDDGQSQPVSHADDGPRNRDVPGTLGQVFDERLVDLQEINRKVFE